MSLLVAAFFTAFFVAAVSGSALLALWVSIGKRKR